MQIWALTDPGNLRLQNQDAYETLSLGYDRALLVVCDGMGGARAGNVASELAVKAFSDHIRASHKGVSGAERIFSLLREALARANRAVYEKAQSSEDYAGMGTTLVATLIVKNTAYLINVGDSRAYHFSQNGVQQITQDHSLVQMMVLRGELTPEQAKNFPGKNLITRLSALSRRWRAMCLRRSCGRTSACCCAPTGSPTRWQIRRCSLRWRTDSAEATAASALCRSPSTAARPTT